MSDYFHEQMVGKMKLEVTVPIDSNTTFPVKILTEGKAKEMILQALEDVKAEIDTEYKKFRNKSDKWDERANGIGTALEIIDNKIKEIKNECTRSD